MVWIPAYHLEMHYIIENKLSSEKIIVETEKPGENNESWQNTYYKKYSMTPMEKDIWRRQGRNCFCLLRELKTINKETYRM